MNRMVCAFYANKAVKETNFICVYFFCAFLLSLFPSPRKYIWCSDTLGGYNKFKKWWWYRLNEIQRNVDFKGGWIRIYSGVVPMNVPSSSWIVLCGSRLRGQGGILSFLLQRLWLLGVYCVCSFLDIQLQIILIQWWQQKIEIHEMIPKLSYFGLISQDFF